MKCNICQDDAVTTIEVTPNIFQPNRTIKNPRCAAHQFGLSPKIKVKNYKITPEQLCEIESHLQIAAHILNSENIPDWEDLQTACRQICDAQQNLKWIREKSETPMSATV